MQSPRTPSILSSRAKVCLVESSLETWSFNLEQNSHLEVLFVEPCLAMYDSPVKFESVVRANLSYGGLLGPEGVSQEELFLWLPVKDIIVTDPWSGVLLVNIVVAFKQLSLSLFEDPPFCSPPSGAVREVLRGEVRIAM
ncbi:hypothetical protein AKJ16_DCAP25010 [Drosera capensis]